MSLTKVSYSMIQGAVFNILDYGADPTGSDDSTDAIQAAIDAAYAEFIGTNNYGLTQRLGGNIVYLPAGKYLTSDTLDIKECVTLQGAGRTSTVIQSTAVNGIIVNLTLANYDSFGRGIKDMTIIGDRTKTNQAGVAILRDWFGVYENVSVQSCGSTGWRFLQAINTQCDNIEGVKCVGDGIVIEDGQNSWTDSTPNNLPSNNVVVINGHFYNNDGAGIHFRRNGSASSVNGCSFYNGSAEYNYASSQGSGPTGSSIFIESAGYFPNEFNDFWVEGGCEAHIIIDSPVTSSETRFTNLKHGGNGASGFVKRAAIVQSGILKLDGAVGLADSYQNLSGSISPFTVYTSAGYIYANDLSGSLVTDNLFVEDQAHAHTGLYNNLRMNNYGICYGAFSHTAPSGQIADQWQLETQTYPFAAMVPGYGLYMGDGSAAVSARLTAGAGSPNGVVTANPGSLYMNTSGGANTSLYVKESGAGNTGWVAK